jgi:HEAT repeat protein
MRKQTLPRADLESLMGTLESKDGATRQRARKSLATLGKPAVSSLTRALQNSELDHVRWEAAKTLSAIGDSTAIPSLVRALEDSDPDVAWSAAEALRKFKKIAWSSLLRALMKSGADSVLLRHGAHHVFRNQKMDGFNDLLAALTSALESSTVPESTTVAAYDILKRMKAKP